MEFVILLFFKLYYILPKFSGNDDICNDFNRLKQILFQNTEFFKFNQMSLY